jgi:copper chaperone CopZ
MKRLIKQIFLGLLLVATFSAAQADGLLRVEQTVFGMDCAPCAYALQKGLSKLAGVTKVEVSLNDGKALVEFVPGSITTFSQFHDIIVHGGFTPREAVVVVAGKVAQQGGQLVLLADAGGSYRLVIPAGMDATLFKPGTPMIVQGEIPAEAGAEAVPGLMVQRIL